MSGLSVEDADINELTPDKRNRKLLLRIKNDDPHLTQLCVGGYDARRGSDYVVEDARGMGVLGYYLGRSTHVTSLGITFPLSLDLQGVRLDVGTIEPFLAGLRSNRSIEALQLMCSHIPQHFFQLLAPFIKANTNLTGLEVESPMDAEQYHALSSALREGKSLKHVVIGGLVRDGHHEHQQSIIANIEALKMHPQLEELHFNGFSMGRNVCAALADLLRQSSGVKKLSLMDNVIHDAGVEALVGGLAHCRDLQELKLSDNNPVVTVRGWRALAALLEDPNSSLKTLYLWENGIDDESAIVFANALAHNSALQRLYLNSMVAIFGESTGECWEAFSKVLCDTSSVNSTFFSNHTLEYLAGPARGNLPDDIRSSLDLNQGNDKKRVAVRKILLHHDDFDMQPLFEWDLKVLPFVIEWFERAAGIEPDEHNWKRKLSAIYQFTRGMPELAVEGITGVSKKSVQIVGEKRPLSCL